MGRKNSRSSAISIERSRVTSQFVVCLDNGNYPASLERHKIYQVLPDASAGRHGQIRVIDESGEDYLYPQECFAAIQLPVAVERALRRAS